MFIITSHHGDSNQNHIDLTPVRMAKINKDRKQHVLERMWRKGNPLTLLVGIQVGAATLENSVETLKKLKIGAPGWLSGLSLHLPLGS